MQALISSGKLVKDILFGGIRVMTFKLLNAAYFYITETCWARARESVTTKLSEVVFASDGACGLQ